MAAARSKDTARIDELMERASQHLVGREYFDAERESLDALNRAFATENYERMARILLPLQECRRQKRDLAFDTGEVFRVTGELPTGKAVRAGCYLVEPPRVGVDGRLLREEADRRKVPVIVVVREPATREGLWPVVALGPVTIRTRIPPPRPVSKSGRARKAAGDDPAAGMGAELPPPEWFVTANEALGDTAIAQVDVGAVPALRVQALLERLSALPDHEKLHQALADACTAAAHAANSPRPRRPKQPVPPLDAPGISSEDADDDDLDTV